jgi:circadian clock protein KaiC
LSEDARVARPTPQPLHSIGIAALDGVLGGGLTPNRMYMVEGVPGSGKTTLGLQYLMAGVAAGESTLYVTLSESEDEVRAIADSHGWDFTGLNIVEIIPDENHLTDAEQYTVFAPSEVELNQTLQGIIGAIERHQPSRVVVDSLSELRLLAGSALRYRRQILGLKQFFAGRHCTVLVLDDRTATADDPQAHSIAHGIISLDQWVPAYGGIRRRVRIVKYRGMSFVGGLHDCRIDRGGLKVFPRLVRADRPAAPSLSGSLTSGVPSLDRLLGGGLERGTSTLLAGAPGTGKSTLASVFVAAALARGERAAMFLFDESISTLCKRMAGMGIDFTGPAADGRLHLQQINPAELSPGEFASAVVDAASRENTTIVVIDSLNGYVNAMPDDKVLNLQLHELLSVLSDAGIATVMVNVQQGLIGTRMTAPVDASYLADSVVVLRYFESQGCVRQAVSVIKKRSGPHERAICEFSIDSHGVHVGAALDNLHGVLTGVPSILGAAAPTPDD